MSPTVPLFRPREYFEQHPSPHVPGPGVLAVHVVGSIVAFVAVVRPITSRIGNPPPAGERAFETATMTASLPVVVVSVVSVLLVAVVMHKTVGGAEGSLEDDLGAAGWSYAPELLSQCINYLLARREITALELDGSEPEALTAPVDTLGDPAGVAAVGAVAVVAWSVYILTEGTAGTRGVERREVVGPARLSGSARSRSGSQRQTPLARVRSDVRDVGGSVRSAWPPTTVRTSVVDTDERSTGTGYRSIDPRRYLRDPRPRERFPKPFHVPRGRCNIAVLRVKC